jgi:acetyl-CoA carboxylase biotin carboxyl carrier protein
VTDDARGADRPAHDDGDDATAAEVVVEVDGVAAPEAMLHTEAPTPRDGGDVELLALIDRLAALLDRSDLSELEVESGGTGLVLRKPVPMAVAALAGAVAPAGSVGAPGSAEPSTAAGEPSTAGRDPATTARPSVKAPLTGIFYASPAPGSAPYVQVGGELAVGQVIGLIEAMKLFNEIKSDLAGRVVRVIPETGTLVKAKQPLVEVEPL